MNAQVVHALPGRIRLVVPEMKRNPPLADELCQRLADGAAIDQVSANPLIGSLVLTYTPSRQQHAFCRIRQVFPHLEADALRNGNKASARDRAGGAAVADGVAATFQRLDKTVESWTGGFDLRILVPLLLVLFAAGSLLLAALRRKSVLMPSWYDLIWFAFNTFIILNLPLVRRHEQ